MYAKDAMDSFFAYKVAHKKALFYLVLILAVLGMDFQSEQGQFFGNFFVLAASYYASKVACMLHLDSELMDLHEEDLEDSGYNKDLVDITLTLYINDDECENNTRFSKLKIMTIMHYLGFGDGSGYIRVYYNGPVYYKFRAVTLYLYMLRKMSTARTQKDLADNKFGGSSGRWRKGSSKKCFLSEGT